MKKSIADAELGGEETVPARGCGRLRGDEPEISGKKQGNVGRGKPPVATRFQPGQSGNPKGKPVGTLSITKHIRAALQANDEAKARELAEAMIAQACSGNGAALKQLLDRIDGVVRGELELTNPDGAFKPLVNITLPDNGRYSGAPAE